MKQPGRAAPANAEVLRVRSWQQAADARTLFLEYAEWLAVDLCFQNFEAEVAALPGSYSPPKGELLVAYIDSEPAGCVALHEWEADTAEIKRLYVRDRFRGHGIGKRLLSDVIEIARGAGYRRVRLDSIADRMPAAIGLYKAFGFRQIEPYRFNPEPSASYWEVDL
jgi:GNAT superfamily N-acetyltransferase